VYLFGALCPARAVGAAVVMPSAKREAMSIHLAEIGTQVAPDAPAVVLCDGAGWHQTGGELAVPGNITLLPTPPYSPELNPMENVWDYLRGDHLSHLVWGGYDDIVQACAKAWRFLIGDPDESAPSKPESGHVSAFRRVGIRLDHGATRTRHGLHRRAIAAAIA